MSVRLKEHMRSVRYEELYNSALANQAKVGGDKGTDWPSAKVIASRYFWVGFKVYERQIMGLAINKKIIPVR